MARSNIVETGKIYSHARQLFGTIPNRHTKSASPKLYKLPVGGGTGHTGGSRLLCSWLNSFIARFRRETHTQHKSTYVCTWSMLWGRGVANITDVCGLQFHSATSGVTAWASLLFTGVLYRIISLRNETAHHCKKFRRNNNHGLLEIWPLKSTELRGYSIR